MTEIEDAFEALAERGEWLGPPCEDGEMLRVEVRRGARMGNIKVGTGVDRLGRPHAVTVDGWRAHEPWRGAAIHAVESGVEDAELAAVVEKYGPGSVVD